MTALRVLLTNMFVAYNSGSDTVIELLADGLRRAGHRPMILAPTLGAQADRMRVRGHILVDRVAALPARPDVIHAQHTPVALAAMAAFPDVPTVFTCHSASYEVEAPRPHPQIRQWVAVDTLCRDRCLSRGVPPDRLTVIGNGVDLRRFARREPLPARPLRALLLSKNLGHDAAITDVCAARGIALHRLGPAFGNVTDRIEAVLPDYDLVFATARMALEAACVGCAVVVCDARGFAGLLTSARLATWRSYNFGAGLLAETVSTALLDAAIEAYDPADAALVTDALRAEASIDDCVARYLACYAAAMADPAPIDPSERAAATAAWIEDLTPSRTTGDWRAVARELFAFTASPEDAASQAAEARLVALQETIEARLAELREVIARPSIAQLIRRRLTPFSLRQALYRRLGGR